MGNSEIWINISLVVLEMGPFPMQFHVDTKLRVLLCVSMYVICHYVQIVLLKHVS